MPGVGIRGAGAAVKMSLLRKALNAIRRNGGSAWFVPDDFGVTLGPELVTNGSFDSASGWNVETNWSISGGAAVASSIANNSSSVYQNLSVTTGKTYRLTYTVVSISAGQIREDLSGGVSRSSAGTYTSVFVASGSTTLAFRGGSGPTTCAIDNISVREVLFAQLYTDSTGTTPVTAVGDVIGLLTDRSYGSSNLGPELVTNGGFDSDTWWTKGTGVTISGGKCVASSPISGAVLVFGKDGILTVGKRYQVTIAVDAIVGTIGIDGGVFRASPGTITESFVASSANFRVLAQTGGGLTSGTFDNVSVKEVLGSHATQATTANKPTIVRIPRKLGPNLVPGSTAPMTTNEYRDPPMTLVVGRSYNVRCVTSKASGTSIDIGVTNGAYGWHSGAQKTTAGSGDTFSYTFVASDTVGRFTAVFNSATGSVSGYAVQEVLEWSNAIQFDGTNDSLQLSAVPFQVDGDQTIITSGYVSGGVSTARTMYGQGNGGTTENLPTLGVSTAEKDIYYAAGGGVTQGAIGASSLALNTPFVVSAKVAAKAVQTYRDGVASASATLSGTYTTATIARIGANGRASSNEFWPGTIAFIAAMPNAISDADRKAIERAAAYVAGSTYAG